MDTFLDGWKVWSSACIGNRGYKTLPQRQKGIIQVALLVLSPLILPCSIVLALPGSFAIMAKLCLDECTFFRRTVRDSGLFFNTLWLSGAGLLAVGIIYPIGVAAIILATSVFLLVTPFDIIIDIAVWIVRKFH